MFEDKVRWRTGHHSEIHQHLANIANALLSTGPRTEAGKVRAAMNARRHGLTG